MELSVFTAERAGLVRKALKTSEPLFEKSFQDQDLVAPIFGVSFGCLGMNYRKKIT